MNIVIEASTKFHFFTTQIEITGTFSLDGTDRLSQSLSRDNQDAYIFVALSDIRSVRSAVAEFGKEVHQFHSTHEPSGVSAIELPIATEQLDQSDSFKISINPRFTERLGIVLAGNQSTLNASSTWPHPSIDGCFDILST